MSLQERQMQIKAELILEIKAIIDPVLGEGFKTHVDIWDGVLNDISINIEVCSITNAFRSSFQIKWDARDPGLQIWNVQAWNDVIAKCPEITKSYRAAMRVVDKLEELNAAFAALDFSVISALATEIAEEEAAAVEKAKAEAKAKIDALIATVQPGKKYLFPQSKIAIVKEVTRTRVFFEDGTNVTIKSFTDSLNREIVIPMRGQGV